MHEDKKASTSGSPTIQCLESGDWSTAQPTCDEIFCLPLPDPIHGLVEYTTGTGVNITNGTQGSVSCQNGYYYNQTSGNADTMCIYGI